ncbi:MAG: hypothetical protein CM15mP68_1470 [Pseudomonadota bacterium]|nr:MAG: hypothetical protein CM15mP68_1470 [Pseudomonadota bacterium]
MLRTFRKRLQSCRPKARLSLGSPKLIAPILKTRDSYNVDAISQCLGLVALQDQPYAQSTGNKCANNDNSAQGLSQLGWLANQRNQLLLATPPSNSAGAASIYQQLKAANILVRYFDHPRLNDKLRISVGTAEQNRKLLTLLQRFSD